MGVPLGPDLHRPDRVLALGGVHDQVVERLAAFAGYLPVGDPLAEETVVGPVITGRTARVESFVGAGRTDGAEVVTGGERPAMDRGWYVPPTLLAGCAPEMSVVQDEIFGPVLSVVPFGDEDEAVALANGTSYGLYDYVWTADGARVAVGRRLRTGNVGLNTLQRNHEAPFGGFKKSGVGATAARSGSAYSELQSIVWSTWRAEPAARRC